LAELVASEIDPQVEIFNIYDMIKN